MGTVDAVAEAVSVGVQAPGDMMLMYGSTIFIIEVTDRPVRDPRLWYAPWLVPGTHASMAGLATSGTLTRWFRDELARDAGLRGARRRGRGQPRGAKGLLCLPHFSGERTPIHDPQAKGAFVGLDLTHTRGDLFRAVLEGIAAGTAHVSTRIATWGRRPNASTPWAAGRRTRCGCRPPPTLGGVTQLVRQRTVGASYGDAFLAAVAVGTARPADIERWNPVVRTVRPERVPAYERQYPLWKALYERTRDIAHAAGRRIMSLGRAVAELAAVMAHMDESALEPVVRAIASARRTMLYGCGREGLMMRALAMRLHHLGLEVCMQGDMAAFPLGPDDLFLCAAGPGSLSTASALCRRGQGGRSARARRDSRAVGRDRRAR